MTFFGLHRFFLHHKYSCAIIQNSLIFKLLKSQIIMASKYKSAMVQSTGQMEVKYELE